MYINNLCVLDKNSLSLNYCQTNSMTKVFTKVVFSLTFALYLNVCDIHIILHLYCSSKNKGTKTEERNTSIHKMMQVIQIQGFVTTIKKRSRNTTTSDDKQKHIFEEEKNKNV